MKIRFDDPLPPLPHAWRLCFGQGSAAELLRADVLDHLRTARQAIGFRYLRFHGLFHDDLSVVSRRADGKLAFHWGLLDRALDALRDLGIRPFLELGPTPGALASGSTTIFRWKMNVTPPIAETEWAELVGAFTTHCVQRYGRDEVRNWYFEVWNEPNLAGFWTGSRDDYFHLYRATAQAVKTVDPTFRVGGPATAQAQWIPEFLHFCSTHAVPVDFISTHSYLQDQSAHRGGIGPDGDPSNYLTEQFIRVQREVQSSPWPNLEIHWTEWNALTTAADGTVSWTENPCMDARYAGTLALDHAVRADGLCTSLSWWVVTDVFGEDGVSPLPYSSAYGLLSRLGHPKPPFHAFHWLGQLTGSRLRVDGAPEARSCGVLATQDEGVVRALLWFHPGMGGPTAPWQGSLAVTLPVPATLVRRQLGAASGSGWEHWDAAGRISNLTTAQEAALRALAEPTAGLSACAAGPCEIDFTLGPHEILFLEWAPTERPAESRGIHRPEAFALEEKLAAVSL